MLRESVYNHCYRGNELAEWKVKEGCFFRAMFEATGATLKTDFSCEICNIEREFCEGYLRGEYRQKKRKKGKKKLKPLISIKDQ